MSCQAKLNRLDHILMKAMYHDNSLEGIDPRNLSLLIEQSHEFTKEERELTLELFSSLCEEELKLFARWRGEEHAADCVAYNVPEAPFASFEEAQEAHTSAAYDAEEGKREYAGFEYTAGGFNSSPIADELWEAFDEGIAATISSDLSTYGRGDYNIVSQNEDNNNAC